MTSRAVALAVLLVTGLARADGPRVVLEVERGTIVTTEGREAMVRGGAYLDNDTLLSTSKELAALRAENKSLREAPVFGPAAVITAVVLAAALGFGAARLSR